MKRNLFALAATTALVAGTATADQHVMEEGSFSGLMGEAAMENVIRTSNIIGGSVYGVDADYDMNVWDETDYYTELDPDWEQIGNIDDIALSRDGQLTGLVVESGGFLGIGDQSVLIEMGDLRMVDDGTGDYGFVTSITEDQFDTMPEVEENWF